jgi:hypothetical protein
VGIAGTRSACDRGSIEPHVLRFYPHCCGKLAKVRQHRPLPRVPPLLRRANRPCASPNFSGAPALGLAKNRK